MPWILKIGRQPPELARATKLKRVFLQSDGKRGDFTRNYDVTSLFVNNVHNDIIKVPARTSTNDVMLTKSM